MLLSIGGVLARPARAAVVAYDVGNPRRARRTRACLQAVQERAQYSVFELQLTAGETRGLLAELATTCKLDEDLLAIWWPSHGRRVEWQGGRLTTSAIHDGRAASTVRQALAGHYNFIVCYDVRDPDRLRRLGASVAREAAQLQRSVYWLRLPADAMLQHASAWVRLLHSDDQLWLYPLRAAGDLWQLGGNFETGGCGLFPVSAHNRSRAANRHNQEIQ